MFPKIDIASEKAIIENWTPEEVADGHREIGTDIDVFEETPKNDVAHQVTFSR